MEKFLELAREEHKTLLMVIADLGKTVGELKHERASLLVENDLLGGGPELQRVNEKLHNARRVLNAWNRRRECLAFLIDYVAAATEGGTNEAERR
jgi:hypothetical protein